MVKKKKKKKKDQKRKIIQNVKNDEHQKQALDILTQNQSFKFIQIETLPGG